MNDQNHEFSHPELNQQITAIGGNYTLIKELRLPFGGQEIVCLLGAAIFDTSCCGAGGCAYALVPGFVRKWKFKTGLDGRPVSLVEPISDPRTQEGIKHLILQKQPVHQVSFL